MLARHVTTHRSKKLQQERKHASRSSPSMPISLASAYDSKEIVSKALSTGALDGSGEASPPPAFLLKGQDVTLRNGSLHLPVDRVLLVLKDQRLVLEDIVITGARLERLFTYLPYSSYLPYSWVGPVGTTGSRAYMSSCKHSGSNCQRCVGGWAGGL